MTDDKIVWVADEYKSHEHDTGWYAGLFLFGAILIAWALYTNNVITTILFVLIVFVIYVLSHHEPNKVLVEIAEKGIKLNNVFYPYKNLKHFWILENDGEHEPVLTVETKALINRHLSIELEDQDVTEVRRFLAPRLAEIEDYEENFVDFLIRKLKI